VSKLTSGLLVYGWIVCVCLMTSKIQAIMKEQEKRTVRESATHQQTYSRAVHSNLD